MANGFATTGFGGRGGSADVRSEEFKGLLGGLESRVTEGARGTEFELPEFDRARVSALTQSYLSPQIEAARRIGRENIISAGPSSFARAYQTRQTLRGIGEMLPGAQIGATKSALGEYLPEFQGNLEKARAEFQAGETGRQSDLSALARLYSGQRDTTFTRPGAGGTSAGPRERVFDDAPSVSPSVGGYRGKYADIAGDNKAVIIARARDEGWSREETADALEQVERIERLEGREGTAANASKPRTGLPRTITSASQLASLYE